MGTIDAYYVEGPGISTWDIAAASLIISEAGGIVVDRVTGKLIYVSSFNVKNYNINILETSLVKRM